MYFNDQIYLILKFIYKKVFDKLKLFQINY